MVVVFEALNRMDCSALAELYELKNRKEERDFVEYLRDGFFRNTGARYYVWLENGRYVAALRLEPWEGKLLLSGLQTHPACRRQGYGFLLMQSVLQEYDRGNVYSHIHHRNRGSIALHLKAGFRRTSETARLLDGTVTSQYGTYIFG